MLMVSCYSKKSFSFYPRLEYVEYEIIPRNDEELAQVKELLSNQTGDKLIEIFDIKLV